MKMAEHLRHARTVVAVLEAMDFEILSIDAPGNSTLILRLRDTSPDPSTEPAEREATS